MNIDPHRCCPYYRHKLLNIITSASLNRFTSVKNSRPRVVIKFHKIFSQWDRKYYWHSSLFFVFATQYWIDDKTCQYNRITNRITNSNCCWGSEPDRVSELSWHLQEQIAPSLSFSHYRVSSYTYRQCGSEKLIWSNNSRLSGLNMKTYNLLPVLTAVSQLFTA